MPTEISNGESGLSIRTKLNTLFETVETTVANRLNVLESGAALANIVVYSSRSALVSAWTNGLIPNGGLVSDGNVIYKALLDATDISDLTGLIPFGQISLHHFTSALGDGTTSITAALQEAINYASGGSDSIISLPDDHKSVYIPPGIWLSDDADINSVHITIRAPVTIWSDGPMTGTIVTNVTDEVLFLIEAENADGGDTVSHVNFSGLSIWNSTNPSNLVIGKSPLFTADCVAIKYSRSMGTVQDCILYNYGSAIDIYGAPEGVRLSRCDFNLAATSEPVSPNPAMIENTACVRVLNRPGNIGTAGTSYTAGGVKYVYNNSIFISDCNFRSGPSTTIRRHEGAIIIEGVDGLWLTNCHVAWGTLAPVIVRTRHANSPMNNINFSNSLIDPFPGKSEHGVIIHDYYSVSPTGVVDITFSNCDLAGCTSDGVLVSIPMRGFQWIGGSIKQVGTTAGSGIHLTGSCQSSTIKNITFREVGNSSSDYCVKIEASSRTYVDGITADFNTYGLVGVIAGALDVTVGSVRVNTILGGKTIVIPATSAQVKVSNLSHIAESTSLSASATLTPPLGEGVFYVTGTGVNTITTISTSVLFNHREFTLIFQAAETINETGNIKLGTASITTEAGRAYKFVYSSTTGKVILL